MEMSMFRDPFDPRQRLQASCRCGRHRSETEHRQAEQTKLAEGASTFACSPIADDDQRLRGVVASAVMRAMFPHDAARRAFLRSVGASTALAALSQVFPLDMATEVFAQGGAIEKKDVKVGFIPITCATPI